MASDEFDLYDALNISPDASLDDIRGSFRELSRLYHPDKGAGAASNGDVAGREDAFMRVHRAYRVLGDDVLRPFYDRFGMHGIRLAESLSDDEGEGDRQLALPEDRLHSLERRVRKLVRRHHELKVQRLLALQGSFTLSVAASPGALGDMVRRQCCLQYSAISHSVQVALGEHARLTVGCASHVQGPTGVGAAKFMLAASSRLGARTTARASLTVAGGAPEVEAVVVQSVTPSCSVHQKVSLSAESKSMSLMVQPWLSRTLRGSIGCSLGADPGLSIGLIQRSESFAHNARVSLNLQPGTGELGGQVKFKPSKDFSLALAPTISPRGWGLGFTCAKAFGDGLTKMHWTLRFRPRGASLRLSFYRAGLRFVLPVELWPEAAGPLPLAEASLAFVLWAAPPLAMRFLCEGSAALRGAWRSQRSPGEPPATCRPPSADAPVSEGEERPRAAAQRRLLVREAGRRRAEEEACSGLIILAARYGDATLVEAQLAQTERVLDVTDCLMSRVRSSRLSISDAPKSSLLGFCNPCSSTQGAQVVLALWIRYSYGSVEYTRIFEDSEPFLLP